jgi:hypothetical protein
MTCCDTGLPVATRAFAIATMEIWTADRPSAAQAKIGMVTTSILTPYPKERTQEGL